MWSFGRFFQKVFFFSKAYAIYIHPQKDWLLYLLHLVIFLILNDRHNQQKFKIIFCWLWRSFKTKNITKYEKYTNQNVLEMNILHLLQNKNNSKKSAENRPYRFEVWSVLDIFLIHVYAQGTPVRDIQKKMFLLQHFT